MTDEELIESLRLWNRDDAADRIELLATTNEQLVATNEALVKERDEWKSLAEAVIADDASKNIHYAEVQHRAEATEAALKAIDPAAIREAALREAAEICTSIIKDYDALAIMKTYEPFKVQKAAKGMVSLARQDILALIDKKEG